MDEKKTYSVIGNVTIGTDEYRDLIERALEAEKEVSDFRSRYWNKESEAKEMSKKNKELEEKLATYREFIALSEDNTAAFKMFTFTKKQQEEEQEEF